MPQMAPISWVLMLMFFILNLFLFSTFNYSSFNVNYSNNYNSLNKKNLYMIESDNKSILSFWPSTSIMNLSINWLSTSIGLTLLPLMFWLIPNRSLNLWNKIIITLHKEFKVLINSKTISGSTLMFISIFSIILFNNLLGLMPYIFTSSSHMVMTLTLAMPLWLSFMIFGWINNTLHMFAHLVPQGTPPILMPFMVCIETISNIIRPGTLAVRLTANMIAGHLLLTLLGNTGPSIQLSIFSLLVIAQVALLTLESAVALIQSYVFTVLSTLYSSEVI